MGPIGSGKSTGCVIEILRRSMLQEKGRDGKRRTRWAIIRNSYPELRTTTLKTWQEWCPPSYGRLTMDSPIRHHVQSGELDMEILFLALDRDEDVRKLLSLELTGAWLNEAREIPKAILDALTGRVGRFPSKASGGCTWSGIIMDTNAPDDQSWWYKMAEEETPHGYEFFHQPPGDSAEAENIENLPAGYYARLIPGKEEDWIRVYVKADYGFLIEGKPVYPMYRDRTHCAEAPLVAAPGLPIRVGADYGLTPAAIFGQRLPDGRWQVLEEFTTGFPDADYPDACGIIRFGLLIAQFAADKFPHHAIQFPPEIAYLLSNAGPLDPLMIPRSVEKNPNFICTGDPAGNERGGETEQTLSELLSIYSGWEWKAAPSNVFSIRREVVVSALNRMIDGRPGFLLSPACKVVRKGFVSGYHFKFVRTSTNQSQQQIHTEPAKNQHSHPHDGLQYLLLGGGELQVAMRQERKAKRRGREHVVDGADYNPLG